jgi:RNAse (barnase) inhibitor barstar
MAKILQFQKIASSFKFAGVGMGGNLFIILNSLLASKKDDNLYVDMETHSCACTEDNFSKFNTNNCWEYYYDQIKKPNTTNVVTNKSENAILNYKKIPLVDYSDLQYRFNNNFKLKDYLQSELDSYYNNNLKDKITLGVQIRLTDMLQHHNVSPLSKYLIRIQEILNKNPNIEQLFIATDDHRAIEEVKKHISIPIIYHEAFRASDDDPHTNPYDRHNQNIREDANYLLSLECIKEIYTLSMCNFLLRADVSAISNVAILLSTRINKLYNL